ncbi:MAG TPA: GIY-YIG nuclease family protein [Pseudomonadales bacterium]|nr:GIY-YIG nuclease family protein [Pseudomonadales bacterium]
MKGQGCPSCPARYDQPTNLYLMHNGLGKVKIGYSIDTNRRISQLNQNAPFEAELLETWTLQDTPAARKIESKVHRKLAKYHAGLSGFDGATEWFNTTPERAKKEINAILINYAILNHTIANQPQLSLF